MIDQIKDGKLVKEGFKNMIEQIIGTDSEKIQKAMDIFDFCDKTVTGSDPCDQGAKLGLCLKVEGEKHDIKLSM